MAWQKLDSTTFSSAGTSVSSGTYTGTNFNQFLIHALQSGAINYGVRPNNDSSGSYADRASLNGGADATQLNRATIECDHGGETQDKFTVLYMINITTEEKLVMGFTSKQGTAGAGNAPNRDEFVCKWINTLVQMNNHTMFDAGAGDLAIGTNITLIGTTSAVDTVE